MEAHKRNIGPVIEESLTKAGLNGMDEVDAIAVTRGPGLEICLRVGITAARVDEPHSYSLVFYVLMLCVLSLYGRNWQGSIASLL